MLDWQIECLQFFTNCANGGNSFYAEYFHMSSQQWVAVTLPQNAAQRPLVNIALATSQDTGITTVMKFRPMPIKYYALQRANMMLQLDSPVIVFPGFARAAVPALPRTDVFQSKKLPIGVNSLREHDLTRFSRDGTLSQEVRQRKNNIRLRSIACAREAVSRARGWRTESMLRFRASLSVHICYGSPLFPSFLIIRSFILFAYDPAFDIEWPRICSGSSRNIQRNSLWNLESIVDRCIR